MNTKRIDYNLRTYAIDKLFYTSKELGPIYTNSKTTFNAWAPTATEMNLIEYLNNGQTILHPMKKDNEGVFSITIKGNLDGFVYNYQIKFDNLVNEAVDPYVKATTVNGKKGVVVNLLKTNPKKFTRLAPFTNPVDAVIYELSIRDFTVDPNAKFKNKGKFLGLCENKAIKYLKSLGITHVQMMPIYNFSCDSVDELHPFDKYNWGYDPVNYNVVEGAFATDPTKPTVRIKELKKLIKTLHDNGIRVIMDVVYNHVYDAMQHSFEKLVPDYGFRKDEFCNFSNGSGCGNDVASDHLMIRKYIVDSVVYWANEYKLDGFRFDLMGILDVTTMNEIRKKLDEIDPSIIMLGEGWHLNTDLDKADMATQTNAGKMPGVAFFNDDIRNDLKGSTYEQITTGFVNSWKSKKDSLVKSIMGGLGLYSYTSPNQLVQYVEAHDDYTLFDQLGISSDKNKINEIKKMHKMATSIALLAQGISFIHSGQEFYRTKYNIENSYKSSDKINKFDWSRMKSNKKYVNYVSDLIKFKKNTPIFRLNTYEEIKKAFKLLKYSKSFIAYQLGEYLILANTSKKTKVFNISSKYAIISSNYKFNDEKKILNGNINVTSLNFMILKKEK